MEVRSRDIITQVVPRAYRMVGGALGIEKCMPDFDRRLQFAECHLKNIAVIEERLRTAGLPGRLLTLAAVFN
jgi:hypothetical protein